jgi:hypothetical protein
MADVYEGTFGRYLKVSTNVLETVGTGKNAVEVRGTKILGLQQDADKKWGFGEGTKLDLFLKKYKVHEVEDLVGQEVILQSQVNKDNTEFISFN